MTLLEMLDRLYKRKKSGELSNLALNFCKKNNLDLNKEYSNDELIIACSTLSNKEKRVAIITALTEEKPKQENKNTDLLELRRISYKDACKKYHPDNKITGDEGVFKFIQNYKYRFWKWDGTPTKDINAPMYWDYYRYYDNLVASKGHYQSNWSAEEIKEHDRLEKEYYNFREGVR